MNCFLRCLECIYWFFCKKIVMIHNDIEEVVHCVTGSERPTGCTLLMFAISKNFAAMVMFVL